ncbi:aminotransferase class III-fold pyridoxal phosphate-dependent enzyme [Streptomyces globisporus]
MPDTICLSKSISGSGMPMALTLLRPQYDVWRPGDHNGTFRGYNPAFVTAARALETFWAGTSLPERTAALGARIRTALTSSAQRCGLPAPRGRGLVWGLPVSHPSGAREVCDAPYREGLLLETAGPNDEASAPRTRAARAGPVLHCVPPDEPGQRRPLRTPQGLEAPDRDRPPTPHLGMGMMAGPARSGP